jgi:hypothetical protein
VGQTSIGQLIRSQAAVARAGMFGILLAVTSVPAYAQVRQDTLRADTLRADSLVTEQDTVLPPPVMVSWPGAGTEAGGLVDGRWVWDEDALLREGAISLLDLLNRVPGIVTFRTGVYLQQESAAAFAGGADRLVVTWDGYALDPLTAGTLDLSTIQLAHLERVEVDRRPDALVIRLYSDKPTDARAHSRIEAGVGEPDANLFRGLLLTPNFLFGPFGFAVERLEVRGTGRPQPADVFASWLRWGFLSERRGVEVTLRTSNLGRNPESPVPADQSRQDLLVRGRTRFGIGGVAEAYFGRSRLDYEGMDPEIDDSLQTRLDLSARQAGVRLAWEQDRWTVDGAMRWRDESRLPQLDLELAGRARPVDWLNVDAGVANQKWDSGFGATSYWASASVAPLPWLRAFGGFADGRRGSPSEIDSITTPHKSDRRVLRGGGEIRFGRLRAAAAGVRVSIDSIPLLGMPGDSLVAGATAGIPTLDGWEASATVPLLGDWLSLDASWSGWITEPRPVYVPATMGRTGLRIHTIPLESGNFELFARLAAVHRSGITGPPPAAGEPAPTTPARTVYDGYLQIRIIDVRIWIRFDDLAGNDVEDLPGLPIRGPRIFYGVKWSFWN